MKILITGDMGHLGSRASKLLVEAGHEVVGYDIQRSETEDIADRQNLKRAMWGCQCVIHAAAIPHPKHGGFRHYFNVNVTGSANVFGVASECDVQRVVYLSSTGFYGCDTQGRLEPSYFPIDEAHPIASQPGRAFGKLDAYNQSKVMAEQALAWFGTNEEFEAIALRIAPANPKARQYRGGYTWQEYCEDYNATGDNWARGCLFSNAHPDYVAQAIVLAVEVPGPFRYEPFNITDRYTHKMVNVRAFLKQEYPNVLAKGLHPHASLITPKKAMEILGFEPCEDLE